MTIDLHYSLGDVTEEIFRMCALVVGRFNSTPPRTEYHFIWNTQTVSDFIQQGMGKYSRALTYVPNLQICNDNSYYFSFLRIRHSTFRCKMYNKEV